MKKTQKSFVFWAVFFTAAVLAGILGSQIIFPWLAGLPIFEKINWPGKEKEMTTVINKTEKIYLTENLVYQADNDGIFEHGFCKSWPDKNPLPITDCQKLYNQQFNKIKASNIIIRGNLLNLLDKVK